jgi:general secretion pathway protein C
MILQRVVTARQLLPRDVYFWLKAILLALTAVQLARLIWTLLTPLGPVGRWLPPAPAALPAAAEIALLSTYDPFSAATASPALAAAAPAALTGFTLFGTRMSVGRAPGSAIIAGPDGIQNSYSVGEEITPGVRLLGVGFDFVLVGGNGSEQRLAMEGADPPPGAAPPGVAGAGAAGGGALTPAAIRANVAFAPRTAGGRVTGLLVSPLGDPAFLARTGLRDGDVITSVNGRPVNDPSALLSQLSPGARLSLTVERGASTSSVALSLEGNR